MNFGIQAVSVLSIRACTKIQFAALYKTLTGVIHGFGRGGGGVASSCPQLLNSTSFPSDEAVCLIQVQIDAENREVKTSGKPRSQKPVLTPISVTLQEINLNFREAKAKAQSRLGKGWSLKGLRPPLPRAYIKVG